MSNINLKKYKGCRNVISNTLPMEIVERIEAFFDNPCNETWDNIATIIMTGNFDTLWQAVIVVDPTFPRSAGMPGDGDVSTWERIPDTFTVRRAIKHCQKLNS